MSPAACLAIENHGYRPCARPAREFGYAVSLHNHSCYSVEDLASLNHVVKLWFMRPLSGILQRAFGLGWVSGLDYSEVKYNPPYTAENVLAIEAGAVESLGYDGVHLAITDHDEIAAGVDLVARGPAGSHRVGLGEELSVRFQNYVFHLGVTGLAASGIAEIHARLQVAARARKLDEVFEILHASGCLVVFNHPLVPWGPDGDCEIPAWEFLKRYGWAIHALEYNGMRRQEENDRVLALAKRAGKPVVGGGDSHLLCPSSVICVSQAVTFQDFVAEVKSGRAVPLIRPDYFAPLRWKLFLRVLFFMAHYRQIGYFRGEPVRAMLGQRRVLLDPVGRVSHGFLSLVSALGLAR